MITTALNPTIITIANLKGGVGKSLTAWMLARHLHQRGRRVLLIDMDPRATLTGFTNVLNGRHIGHVLGGAAKPTATLRSAASIEQHNIPIVPSHIDLINVAHGLHARSFNRIEALYNAINDGWPPADIIIVDSPGAAEVLMINALYAADLILIPSQPEPASIDAVDETISIIRQTARAKHANIDHNVFINMALTRTNSHKLGIERLRHRYAADIIVPAYKGQDADTQLFAAFAPIADRVEGYHEHRREAVHA